MAVEEWEKVSLADVTYIEMGQSPSSVDCNDEHIGLPFYQGNGEFGFVHPSPRRWTTAPLKLAKAGDILFSVRAPVGEMNIANTDACIGRGLCAIRATKINPQFLFHILSKSKKDLESKSQGSTFAAINKKELFELKIVLPSIPEQKKIAEILGSVDEAIEKTEGVISQIQKVKKGLLHALLTKGIGHTKFKETEIGVIPVVWEIKKIANVMEMKHNPVKVISTAEYEQIGIRSHGKGIFKKPYVKGKELGNKRVFWVQPNCLIVNIVFAWERAIAYTTEAENGKIASHRFPMYFPIDNKVSVIFLTKYFLSKMGNFYIKEASPGGAGRNKTLGQKSFQKIPVPVPPINEQKLIVDTILKIEEMEKAQVDELNTLLRIKSAVMSDLLTGRVRVKLDKKSEKAA